MPAPAPRPRPMPTLAPASDQRPAGLHPAAASRLVAALERTWAAIRRRHPDVPEVVIITGAGSGRIPGGLVLGHFADHRWTVTDTDTHTVTDTEQGDHEQARSGDRHELFVGGEGLARGPHAVLATMLHEAAHGLATARHIKDTSRQGRYHNARYKALAEELGIHIAQHPVIGWSITTLPEQTATAYAAQLADLKAALVLARRSEDGRLWTGPDDPADGGPEGVKVTPPAGGGKPKARNNPVYVCGCAQPRKLRMARATFALGPVRCGLCGCDFAELELDPDAGDHADAHADGRGAEFPAAA